MSLPVLPTLLRFQITEEKLIISKNGHMVICGGKKSISIHTPIQVQMEQHLNV